MHAQPNSNYMDRTGRSDTQARDYEPDLQILGRRSDHGRRETWSVDKARTSAGTSAAAQIGGSARRIVPLVSNTSRSTTTFTTRSTWILATLRRGRGSRRFLPGISSAGANADAGAPLPAASAIGKQQTSARE